MNFIGMICLISPVNHFSFPGEKNHILFGMLRERLLPGMSSYNYNDMGEKEVVFSFISPLEISNYKIHIFLSLFILILFEVRNISMYL